MGSKNHLINVKNHVRSLKVSGCVLCGYSKCFDALHFHHVTDEKERQICKATSHKQVKSEVSKCVLVCANCHAEIHAGQIEKFPNIKKKQEFSELPLLIIMNGD